MRRIIEKRIEKLKELNETEDTIARGYNRSLIRELQSILDEESRERLEQGWDLFMSEGSADGDWQIQKLDEVGAFETDADAIKYVYEQALKGGERHRKALATIAEKNPQELRHIFK